MISAGRLRFTATIKRDEDLDALGKKVGAFDTIIGTFRCDLRDIGVSEVGYGEGTGALRMFEVFARWQAVEALGLLETDRLEVEGMTLSISGIRNETNRDRLATISCEEVR